MATEPRPGTTRFFQVAGFVLAGGDSSRMGTDKGSLEIAGVPLLVRTARLLEPLVSRRAGVTVIAPPSRYAKLELRVLPDDFPGMGPLAGITTALRVSLCPWSLVVGCDMPYLNSAWLGYLMERAVASATDVVIPEGPNGPEPLCAVYHKRCEAAFNTALARGVRKITEAFVGREVQTLPPEEWKKFDLDGLLFKNVNTQEEFAQAKAKLGGESQA